MGVPSPVPLPGGPPSAPPQMGLGWSSAEERQPLLPPPPPQQQQQRRRPQAGGAVGGPAVPAAVPVRRLAPLSGRVYGRRWLVLLLFSLLGFAQGLVWNSWGPIQNSARLAFGFSGWDIALLVFWGPIGFAPCFFFMWLMDKKGERGRGRRGRGVGTPRPAPAASPGPGGDAVAVSPRRRGEGRRGGPVAGGGGAASPGLPVVLGASGLAIKKG